MLSPASLRILKNVLKDSSKTSAEKRTSRISTTEKDTATASLPTPQSVFNQLKELKDNIVRERELSERQGVEAERMAEEREIEREYLQEQNERQRGYLKTTGQKDTALRETASKTGNTITLPL